jgi:hypothetical protein
MRTHAVLGVQHMSKSHNPKPLPHAKRSSCTIAYQVCARCGLIYSRADAARRAARQPCAGADDPEEQK